MNGGTTKFPAISLSAFMFILPWREGIAPRATGMNCIKAVCHFAAHNQLAWHHSECLITEKFLISYSRFVLDPRKKKSDMS